MGIRVIRAIRLPSVRPDAGPIQPRLDVAARPYPAPCVLRIALGRSVLTFGILRPVERKSTADQPFPKIDAVDRTRRDCPPVLIARDRDTVHRAFCDEGVEIVRGLRAAAILQAILAAAELRASGASMPQRRMRVPWISSVSPSTMLACPIKSSAMAPSLDKISISATRMRRDAICTNAQALVSTHAPAVALQRPETASLV
jgi:hypothetical protein